MAVNVYLMPSVQPDPDVGAYPKYRDELVAGATGVSLSNLLFGSESLFFVVGENVPAANHATVAAHADCLAVPDLAQTVGAQLTTVQNRLESMNIPGQWVQSTDSYGSVARVVWTYAQLLRTFQLQGFPRLFGSGITLATKWNQLPAAVQTRLQSLAAEYQFDTSGVSGQTTVRQLFVLLMQQWPAVAIRVGPNTVL